MKKALLIGILAASVVAGSVYLRDNQQTYAMHVYAGGTVSLHDWTIGSTPNWYGLSEYQFVGFPSMESANGTNQLTFPENPGPVSTEIRFGSHYFTIERPAWMVILGIIVALGMGGWFVFDVWRWLSTGWKEAPPVDLLKK